MFKLFKYLDLKMVHIFEKCLYLKMVIKIIEKIKQLNIKEIDMKEKIKRAHTLAGPCAGVIQPNRVIPERYTLDER